MKFTDIFIRRWVLATSVNLVILILGVRAWMSMTVREFPNMTNTVVTVSTAYPGASPRLVQGFITSRLEQAVAQAPGIDYMTATSSESTSAITVYMKLNEDPNAAIAQIMAKVDQVRNQLPPAAQAPVITETVGDTLALMYLAFSSDTLSQQQINDYLLRVVQPKLQSLPGVSQAQILPPGTGSSGNSFALRAWLKPNRLAAFGLTPADVAAALANDNYISAIGRTKGRNIATVITATTSLSNINEFKQLIVKNVGGVPVRLDDVADVEMGAQNYNASVYSNGSPATFIGINITPNANALTVAHEAHVAFREIKQAMPPGLHAIPAYDSSVYIKASINEVIHTLIITLGIVVVVVFLFLGAIRSLLIPLVAIPLSIVGAGIFMLAFGFSINVVTLLAVILAIGLVVDDAIIMLENIQRHLDEGHSRQQAAILGARELAGPIIVMSTTLIAVFAPIGFMGGLTGSLFTEFAFTLVFAVLISMVVALTLSPMMGSKILRKTPDHGLVHLLDAIFHFFRRQYDRSLRLALEIRWVVLLVAAAILVAIPFMVLGTFSELAPTEDQGIIFYSATGPATATLHYMSAYAKQVYKDARSFPETTSVFQVNGFSFVSPGQNTMVGGMLLAPWDQRKRSQMQLLPLFQAKLGQLAGVQAAAFNLPSIPGSSRGFPIQFVIKSTADFAQINKYARKMMGAANASGKFLFMTKDLRYDAPQIVINIHRSIASEVGLTPSDIGQDLEPLLGGNYINRFDMQGRSYKVIPQVPDALRADPSMIKYYYVRSGNGVMIPLSTVASLSSKVEPEFLPQFQQLNAVTLQGVPMPGVTMGTALSYLNTEAKKILPSNYEVDYAGEAREYKQQGNAIWYTFGLAIVLIFLLMAAQFESFRDPLIVMFTVPTSIFGAMTFLFLGLGTLNIYTEVGLITLIGLITKQGILIVEFANKVMEEEGLDRKAAVLKASNIRLRPILMTTAAMVMGVVPLLVAKGAGAVSRFDMGLMIGAGLTVGCLFSLYVVPVVYTFIATVKKRQVANTDPA